MEMRVYVHKNGYLELQARSKHRKWVTIAAMMHRLNDLISVSAFFGNPSPAVIQENTGLPENR